MCPVSVASSYHHWQWSQVLTRSLFLTETMITSTWVLTRSLFLNWQVPECFETIPVCLEIRYSPLLIIPWETAVRTNTYTYTTLAQSTSWRVGVLAHAHFWRAIQLQSINRSCAQHHSTLHSGSQCTSVSWQTRIPQLPNNYSERVWGDR